ncbi:MAG TPA: hypothetical protein VGN17_20330 [Bryobacteraceae bacterium]|jgi:hypothetical protein
MKYTLPLFVFVAAVICPAADAPRVNRGSLRPVETSLDTRISRLWPDNALTLIGSTRGVYLDGYGAVFSAEVNTVQANTFLMHPSLSKEEMDQVKQKQIARVPELTTELKKALVDSAASLDPLGPTDNVVISVILDHYSWEDKGSLPTQITLQAQKSKLLDVKRNNGAGMDLAIKVVKE